MIMSKVLTYSRLSFDRFMNTMSYTIGQGFLDNFCLELEGNLAAELGIDGTKGEALCRRYATDRPQDNRARELCQERIKFLEAAITRLERLYSVMT